MTTSLTGRRQVSSAPNLQQILKGSPEAERIKAAFRRPPRNPKYTPHFLLWFLDVQDDLGDPELGMADAWELYADRASVQDAVQYYRQQDGKFFWHD